MKFTIILMALFSFQTFANDGLTCLSDDQKFKLALTELNATTYKLVVTEIITAKVVSEEKMTFKSYDRPQYTLDVYKGKKSKLEITDYDGIYTYAVKNAAGVFVNKSMSLNCEY